MKPMMAETMAPPMIDITRREEPTLVYAPRLLMLSAKNRGKHDGMKETKQEATAPTGELMQDDDLCAIAKRPRFAGRIQHGCGDRCLMNIEPNILCVIHEVLLLVGVDTSNQNLLETRALL
jgi:hypothetical protein